MTIPTNLPPRLGHLDGFATIVIWITTTRINFAGNGITTRGIGAIGGTT